MRIRTAVIAACFVAMTATAFAAEGTFSRTLSVSGAPTISVATGSGYIHVTTGSQSEVRINAKVKSEHGWSFNTRGTDSDRVRQITSNPPSSKAVTRLPSGRPPATKASTATSRLTTM